jgi:hypothetical protein
MFSATGNDTGGDSRKKRQQGTHTFIRWWGRTIPVPDAVFAAGEQALVDSDRYSDPIGPISHLSHWAMSDSETFRRIPA